MSGPRSSGVLGWSVGLEFDNFRALITSHTCPSNRPVVGEIHSLEAETL